MKKLLILITLLSAQFAFSGTCTSISRTNASANSVLTSTQYNSDLNTVYTHANDLDGGCVTDGTLEKAALQSADFAPLFDSFKDGCKVTKLDAGSLEVGECRLAVDGEWVSTATTATVSMGCGDCSVETASSTFYVYAKDGSTGTTLNLFISDTAPTDSFGEDGSNNKVLARIFNDSGSDIATNSIDQWVINKFQRTQRMATISHTASPTTNGGTCTGGTVHTRTVNTIEGDYLAMGIALSSNQIIFNRNGRYMIDGYGVHNGMEAGQSAWYDVSTSTTTILGSTERSPPGGNVNVHSDFKGELEITNAPETFEVRGECQSTRTNVGFGQSGNIFNEERYLHVNITELGDD